MSKLDKFVVLTSMNYRIYLTCGKDMIQSFIDMWDDDIELMITCTEEETEVIDHIQNDFSDHINHRIYTFVNDSVDCKEFIKRNKDRPDQQNPKELDKGAVRFAPKSYSICQWGQYLSGSYFSERIEDGLADQVMIWLDADVVTYNPVTVEVLQTLMKPKHMVSFLGRENNYPECGFVMYNLTHPNMNQFFREWKNLYDTDTIFQLPEWHDSYVFMVVLNEFIRVVPDLKVNNLSPWGKNYDHVFINSKLGKYMDHMKGNRKNDGSSKLSDLDEHASDEIKERLGA